MTVFNTIRKGLVAGLTAGMALALSGCVSLGVEVPESLLTLSSEATAPVGSSAEAGGEDMASAIAVLTPEVPAKLDVLRVPVNVSATEIAYLEDAIWIDKPARLFRRVLGETLRARAGDKAPLVLDSDDTPLRAGTFLRGTLIELGYDAPSGEVIVRYDAVRSNAQGSAVTRRFEAREGGVVAEAGSVGPALNRAVNTVAGEVADWIME
ncbi:MAG: ABC-type transport auxiliary lipoprotein family protein [Pseudomonadota bacterium]